MFVGCLLKNRIVEEIKVTEVMPSPYLVQPPNLTTLNSMQVDTYQENQVGTVLSDLLNYLQEYLLDYNCASIALYQVDL